MNLTLTINLETAANAGLLKPVSKGRFDGEAVLALLRQQIEQAGPFSGNLRALGAHKGAGGRLYQPVTPKGASDPQSVAIGHWSVNAPVKAKVKPGAETLARAD